MDVVEFVEQVFGLHLMDYQKEFLIKVYEATRDGQSNCTMKTRSLVKFAPVGSPNL